MSGNHPTDESYVVSAIDIKLDTGSRKNIRSITLYKNDQLLGERTVSAVRDHREEFQPPVSVSLQDEISALISYSTKYWNPITSSIRIDISLQKEYRKENEGRSYRKKKKKIEVVVKLHQQSTPLVAITTQIIQACSRFRILIIGNTGVGKSSLINKVFGVDSVQPSMRHRGEADIEQEFTSPKNERIVVHDSLGFEAGDQDNAEIVKNFVANKKEKLNVTDQLHAIWLCLEIPYAGGRLLEKGVEKFLERRQQIIGKIPLVIVLTKVDLLDSQLELDLRKDDNLVNSKSEYMEEHCLKPLRRVAGNDVTHVTVSTLDDYSKSLSDLLKTTDKIMMDYEVGEVPRVMATIAQRISIKEKIELSISIGKQKYWNTLTKSAAFRGHTLYECFEVLRMDIIQVWNFNDPEQWLIDDEITAQLCRTDNPTNVTGATSSSNGASPIDSTSRLYRRLVNLDDLVFMVPLAILKLACPPLKAYEMYHEAKKDVKILLTYIVNQICFMQIIFFLVSGDRVTKETIDTALMAYEHSRQDVQRSVEAFEGKVIGGRDYVLEEIEQLIWLFSITDEEIQKLKETRQART